MNKHLKIAFFMAPLLAIGAYFITGYLYKNQQAKIENGQLKLRGTCLPTENACTFVSSELELKLVSNEKQGQQQLAIISTKPINHLTLGLGNDDQFRQFPIMKSDGNRYWQIKLEPDDSIQLYNQLRIAFTLDERGHFAEAMVTL